MAEDRTPDDTPQQDGGAAAGKGEGGADASGSGNILAGVQPDEGEDETGDERRD